MQNDEESPSVTLVTGSASGLGAAIVRRLRADGRRVVGLDRTPVPGDADALCVDLADTDAAEEAVRTIAEEHAVAAVVTAAGTDACGPLSRVPAKEWERVVRVNLFGTAAVIRAALPSLERSRGRVVTIASTLGLRALPDATAYCASKFGVVGMTRALAAELGDRVGVTLLVPGGMRTAFFDGRDPQYKPAPDAALLDPDDVAESVAFVLGRPAGCEIRELVTCPAREPSWP